MDDITENAFYNALTTLQALIPITGTDDLNARRAVELISFSIDQGQYRAAAAYAADLAQSLRGVKADGARGRNVALMVTIAQWCSLTLRGPDAAGAPGSAGQAA